MSLRSNRVRSVVIIGAGIGGLALAQALRVRGIYAELYEAAREIKPAGGGLIVPPNSARILERLGVPEVLGRGLPLQAMQIFDAGGALLYRRDQAEVRREQGYGLYSVSRPELYRTLLAHVPADTVHTGARLQDLRDHQGRAYAAFANRRHVTGELIVAADGAQSAARQLLFPQSQLQPTGQTALRGLTAAPFTLPAEYASSFTEFWGAGRRFTMFPLASGQVYWHAVYRQDPVRNDGPSDLDARYAAFPSTVGALISATPAESRSATPLFDLPPLPRWFQGNVALLGDAAHATSPNLAQGAAQAIEDADVLARCLAAFPLQDALRHYQQAREGHANQAVARARQLGEIGQVRGPLRWVRNTSLRIHPDLARSRIEAFYEEHQAADLSLTPA